MLTKKHKILLTAISVIVLTAITVSAFAISGGKKPEVISGGFYSPIADRIAVEIRNTDFTLKKSDTKAETFTLTCFISLKKTQADFHAKINSLEIRDIAYDNIVFTALNEASENKTINSLLLPAENGNPLLLEWQTDITITVSGKGTYHPVIRLDYTSGVTEDTAQHKFIDIPLTVTVK